MSDSDYAELKTRYTQEAIYAMRREQEDGTPAAASIDAGAEKVIQQVVAGRDGVEHLSHRLDLLLALGEAVAVPRRRRGAGLGRHRRESARLAGRVPDCGP